jgi:hypothetical protein
MVPKRLIPLVIAAIVAAIVLIALGIAHFAVVRHWLAVHTGTVNESGPFYGFWSGFGSDLTEFGVIGVIATGVYQLVRKFNCHEPGCWRVGTHPAAGGQFLLCYRHHPDFAGKKPTSDVIRRLHEQNQSLQAGFNARLEDVHRRVEALHDHLGQEAPAPPAAEARADAPDTDVS